MPAKRLIYCLLSIAYSYRYVSPFLQPIVGWQTLQVEFVLEEDLALVELRGEGRALLTAENGAAPVMERNETSGLWTGERTYLDEEGWALQSTTHYLQISNASQPLYSSPRFLGLYAESWPAQGFNLIITFHSTNHSDGSLCPENCSGNGLCDTGQCVCGEKWGGIACSLPLLPALLDQPLALVLNSSGVIVALAQKPASLLTISCASGQSTLLVCYLLTSNQYRIPGRDYWSWCGKWKGTEITVNVTGNLPLYLTFFTFQLIQSVSVTLYSENGNQ